mmetsp:Transcript_24760/g.41266  ORF Transcript_24760/g.41266 Transcript_24760/m.41266 type:complete len:316 (-) Transcript_24760:814-1761(-)|eukprot:CAMPEP_0174969362 /NCGR_PEP_ID=MMETSP0004_2-20121128/8714_1 /TAXON_ID=420556 /ORGANISM="Ochromonas sp., Strain CCMP1393" /LENGTH=315 /DNA_ID=CAMNT_0016218831 /DNA_START=181 /DNA_END=1128 /DNA_ORIENTATION=-
METFEIFEKYFNFRPFPVKDPTRNPARQRPTRDVYEGILCGAIAGIAAKTVIAPAERIKMSFQVTSQPFTFRNALAKGNAVIKTQGILSLWRGHSTTILRVAPYSGFSFAIHDFSEDMFKAMLQTDILPSGYKFLAGSIGGVGGTILTYPLDVLRVRLALGGTWKASIRQGGMFQGMGPTLLGIVPYSGTAWWSKQTMLENFQRVSTNNRQPTTLESVIINAIAGLLGQFVSYPLDIIRRRMQVAQTGADGNLPSIRMVWNELICTEGYAGAAKGFSLNIIKGPIALSISLTVYDKLRAYYHSTGRQGRKKENRN